MLGFVVGHLVMVAGGLAGTPYALTAMLVVLVLGTAAFMLPAASTLAVAALFQPIRRRIQLVVEVMGVVKETLQPSSMGIWLRRA